MEFAVNRLQGTGKHGPTQEQITLGRQISGVVARKSTPTRAAHHVGWRARLRPRRARQPDTISLGRGDLPQAVTSHNSYLPAAMMTSLNFVVLSHGRPLPQ
jgi:hypothetical protein